MVSQLAALRTALESLQLGPEHGALVAYCEGLAEVIDAHPERATLWREYRPALELLARLGEVEEDDGQTGFLRLLSTAVGDSEGSGSSDARPGGGGDREDAPSAVDAVAAKSRGRRS